VVAVLGELETHAFKVGLRLDLRAFIDGLSVAKQDEVVKQVKNLGSRLVANNNDGNTKSCAGIKGDYVPPEILSADIAIDIIASRPFYPPGRMELLYALLEDGIEPEVLACRYLTKEGTLRTLLDAIHEQLFIDEENLGLRIANFKAFCDLEQIHGTEKAMRLMAPKPETKSVYPKGLPCPETPYGGPEACLVLNQAEARLAKGRAYDTDPFVILTGSVSMRKCFLAESIWRLTVSQDASKGSPLQAPLLQSSKTGTGFAHFKMRGAMTRARKDGTCEPVNRAQARRLKDQYT
jgi:hypothetical protein